MATWIEENFSRYAAVAAAAMTVVSGLQTYLALPLWALVGITYAFGTAFIIEVCRYIERRNKVPEKFGFGATSPSKKFMGQFSSSLLLLVLCSALAAISNLQINRMSVRLIMSEDALGTNWDLISSTRVAESVTVSMQNRARVVCSWQNSSPRSFPPLLAAIIDWDQPLRRLVLQDFESPQRILVRCIPPSPSGIEVRTLPRSIPVLTEDSLLLYRAITVVLGGIIWLLTVVRLRHLFRSES